MLLRLVNERFHYGVSSYVFMSGKVKKSFQITRPDLTVSFIVGGHVRLLFFNTMNVLVQSLFFLSDNKKEAIACYFILCYSTEELNAFFKDFYQHSDDCQ